MRYKIYVIQQKGNLDRTLSYFLNSDSSFQGVYYETHRISILRLFEVFSIIFDKQSISLFLVLASISQGSH